MPALGRRHVLAGTALALTLSAAGCQPPRPPARETDLTTIGGVSYRLPDGAFADGVIEHGSRDSLLLQINAPGPVGGPPVPVQVLLVAPSAPDAATRARQVRADIATGASVAASLDPRRRREALRPAPRQVADTPAGLAQVVTDEADPIDDDVFVRPPLAGTSEFIACSRLRPAVVSPSCSHEFAGPGFRVKATYPRGRLARWNSIRLAVLGYLQHRRTNR